MSTAAERLQRLARCAEHQDLLHFLTTTDPAELGMLYGRADDVRRRFVGDGIHLRAIIEFSNYCRNDCLYCGIRRSNTSLRRLRMPLERIVSRCRTAARMGFRTVVLQSGEDPYFDRNRVVDLVRRIKETAGLTITLAVGERSEDDYRAFYAAGADRYLLKHETSDRENYARLNPGMSFDHRIDCLKALKRIGFQTGSGIMIGLPGQTLASLADDVLLFRDLDIDMIGCGPYITHPCSPLPLGEELAPDLTHRVIALCRIVTRDTHIPATTALAVQQGEENRRSALCRGANVVMPNLTPQPYRRWYEIYPSKGRTEVFSRQLLRNLEEAARDLGRFLAADTGDRVRHSNDLLSS